MHPDTGHQDEQSTSPHTGELPLGHVEEWTALAVDFLDGRVGENERALIEAHLRSCRECAALMSEQRWVSTLSHEVVPEAAPAGLAAKVMEGIRAVSPRRAEGRTFHRAWKHRLRALLEPRNLAIAAGIVVVVAVGTLTIRAQDDVSFTASSTHQLTTTTLAQKFGESSGSGGAAQTQATVIPTSADQNSAAAGPLATTTASGIMSTTTAEARQPTVAPAGAGTTSTRSSGGLAATSTLVTESVASTSPRKSFSAGAPEPIWVALQWDSVEKDPQACAAEFQRVTGVAPLSQDLWVGGPTFALIVPVAQVSGLLDFVRSQGFQTDITAQPKDLFGNAVNLILAGFTTYPAVSLQGDTLRREHVEFTKLPPLDWSLLVLFASQ